jgi:hypothetical protein
LFAGLTVSSAYVGVLVALLVLGLGMSLTMAPATESIMGSLPRAKAGVGSAVNDTTRQVGGALGVAVLGSVVSSGYATRISSALNHGGLSASAVSSARDSVGGAVTAGQQVGGEAGQALAAAARHGFVGAMRPAMLIAAGVTLAGALIVLVFLPARAVDESEVPVLAESGAAIDAATAVGAAGAAGSGAGAVPTGAVVDTGSSNGAGAGVGGRAGAGAGAGSGDGAGAGDDAPGAPELVPGWLGA